MSRKITATSVGLLSTKAMSCSRVSSKLANRCSNLIEAETRAECEALITPSPDVGVRGEQEHRQGLWWGEAKQASHRAALAITAEPDAHVEGSHAGVKLF